MELISKENAVALIKAEMDKIRTHSLVDGTARLNLRLAKNIIEDMPSIDLADYVSKDFHDKTCEAMAKRHQEDRPQGEWEIVAQGWHSIRRCSHCKWTQTYSDPKYMGYKYNYCPNCGAHMKGADDE